MKYFYVFIIFLVSCKKIQTKKWPISEFTFGGTTYKSIPGEQEYSPGYIRGNGNMGVYSYGYEARNDEKVTVLKFYADGAYMFNPGTYVTDYYSNPYPMYSKGSLFSINFFNDAGYKYYFTSVSGYEFQVVNDKNGHPEIFSNEMLFRVKVTTDPNLDTSIYYKIPFIIRTHIENPY